MTLPRGKAVVRSVWAWGDASSRNRGGFLECAVRPAKMGSQTGLAQRGAVRLAWLGGQTATQNFGRFGFRGSESSGFSSGGHGSGGWHGESTQYGWLGGMFARRSPPRAQYGDGTSHSFEMERRNSLRSSFRVFGPPPTREGWFPRTGYHGGVCGGSFDRRDVLECANPILEQTTQHWFYTFGANPSAESFVHSRARFLI
jgi:hypothetical protein